MFCLMMNVLCEDDRDFILTIFEEYYPYIKKVIYSTLKTDNDTSDLAQDVLTKLIKQVEVLKKLNKEQISSYIYTTAYTTSLNFIKRNSRITTIPYTEDGLSECSCFCEQSKHSLEVEIEKRLEYNEVLERVNKLSEIEQQLFLLRYQCELKYKEIAVALDIKPKTAMVYINRIIKKIKEGEK